MSETSKIQKYVIGSTPYGELPDVLKDLHRISPIDLTSSDLLTAIQDYNEHHLAIVSGQNKQVVLMSNNKIKDSQYIDQIEGVVYTVDHVKQEIIKEQSFETVLGESIKELLKHLKQDVQAYVSEYFKTPNGVQVFAEILQQGFRIHIGLTSKNISINKCYTGQWISKWCISKGSIQGSVNIRAHFFEGGNVQFSNKKHHKEQFQFTNDMGESSKLIIKRIQNFEASVHSSLDNIYEQIPDKSFKKLRRIAPYTKTKMSWNLNSIKMNHNILEGAKSSH